MARRGLNGSSPVPDVDLRFGSPGDRPMAHGRHARILGHEWHLRAPQPQDARHPRAARPRRGWLKEAYADGRVSEDEFDRRIGQVLGRRDPQGPERGVLRPGPGADAVAGPRGPPGLPAAGPAARPAAGRPRRCRRSPTSRLFFLWLLGPGLVFALSPAGHATPGGRRRRRSTSS